jgi:hypothetical protein
MVVLSSFPGFRPWSEQQPDQSSKRQFLKQQNCRHRQERRA